MFDQSAWNSHLFTNDSMNKYIIHSMHQLIGLHRRREVAFKTQIDGKTTTNFCFLRQTAMKGMRIDIPDMKNLHWTKVERTQIERYKYSHLRLEKDGKYPPETIRNARYSSSFLTKSNDFSSLIFGRVIHSPLFISCKNAINIRFNHRYFCTL